MENYTKEMFVNDLAESLNTTKVSASKVLESVFTLLNKAVVQDEKKCRLPVIGGVMYTAIKEAHEARNPQDGSVVQVPKKFKVCYRYAPVEFAGNEDAVTANTEVEAEDQVEFAQ